MTIDRLTEANSEYDILLTLLQWGRVLSYFPFVKNYNVRKKNSNIPQPAYYNSWKDIKTLSTILSLFWVTDLS